MARYTVVESVFICDWSSKAETILRHVECLREFTPKQAPKHFGLFIALEKGMETGQTDTQTDRHRNH